MSWFKSACAASLALLTVSGSTLSATGASAQSSFSEFTSGAGTAIYLGGGTLLPLITDGEKGSQRSLRILDAVVTSAALCYGVKAVIQSPRPDNERALDSFPSCHSMTAFSSARMQSEYHPDWAIAWYAGAALIGYSRIDLNRHRLSDVLIGAGLGYLVAELELGQKRGLILFPLIREDSQGNTVYGMQVKAEF